MRKPIIAIKLKSSMYSALADLANRVLTYMNANVNFAVPSPALADLQTATTDVEDAIAKWGPVGNRGSHADLEDLRLKARILADMLKAEAQYVQLTAQAAASTDYAAMANIITSSGYDLVNAPTPQGTLQKVQNFHQFRSRQLNQNEVKLRWKKPLNVTTVGNVKQYKVLRSNSTDFTTAVEVATTTRTTFTDINTTSGVVVWTYWVIAFNAAGAGVIADPITVVSLGV